MCLLLPLAFLWTNSPSQPSFISQIEKICKVANKPLVVTYTGLIQACLDSGNIQNAVYIFNQMRNFCPPNLVTCNIMLKAYLEHGLFEEANELFNKMLDDGNHISRRSDYKFRVIPDIYTFNTMLDACREQVGWFWVHLSKDVAPWVPLQCKPSSSNGTGCFWSWKGTSQIYCDYLKLHLYVNILLKWMLIASP